MIDSGVHFDLFVGVPLLLLFVLGVAVSHARYLRRERERRWRARRERLLLARRGGYPLDPQPGKEVVR